jgi:ribosomal protein S18 acetylase RimI-like enzyme
MVTIQRASPEQASQLTRIALAAKAHWGYPERWMELWKPQLTMHPEYMRENECWVALVDEAVVGFYTLEKRKEIGWLENLWVLPDYMGAGVGRALFRHAVERARQARLKSLQLEADPHAVGFYERMRMRRIGERRYDMEGQRRILPIMQMELE